MPKIKKIILSIGVSVDINSKQSSEEEIKKATAESRWRPGEITLNGRRLEGRRRRGLDDYEYMIGDQEINEKDVEGFCPSEYIDWRDS